MRLGQDGAGDRGLRGIGAATCRRLAAEGARVAVTDLSCAAASGVAGEIDGFGLELDVHSEVAAAVRAAEAELGPVDVLVNNAGIEGEGGFFANTQPEQWGTERASPRRWPPPLPSSPPTTPPS